MMADIEKMFHQVLVREQDREALRFVWRTNKKEQFRDIRMNVHPFGKVNSPCCCVWTLKKTANNSIPNIIARVKEAITENFYMDNYLDSINTQSEAMEISQQVMAALKEGGFRLTKWSSNDSQILDTLPLSEKSAASVNLDLDDTSIERALGILWNPKMDTLQIKVSDRETPMTKRGILSYTSSIFDPLDILSPIILEPKLIIQTVWKKKVNWDNEIPYDLKNRFEKWKENLRNWNVVEIPRWYYLDKNNDTKLHIFTDASASAYGAVTYFRCKYRGKYKCSFIMSKARLAPMNEKQLIIPRIKLQAAVIGCRMRSVIIEETKCEFKAVYLWTVSKIVINYLKNETTNFGVFITHRINEICNNSTVHE